LVQNISIRQKKKIQSEENHKKFQYFIITFVQPMLNIYYIVHFCTNTTKIYKMPGTYIMKKISILYTFASPRPGVFGGLSAPFVTASTVYTLKDIPKNAHLLTNVVFSC